MHVWIQFHATLPNLSRARNPDESLAVLQVTPYRVPRMPDMGSTQ